MDSEQMAVLSNECANIISITKSFASPSASLNSYVDFGYIVPSEDGPRRRDAICGSAIVKPGYLISA